MAITVSTHYTYDDSTGTYFPTTLAADGVTNDATNLQVVLDACGSTGGTIILPAGTIFLHCVDVDYLGYSPNWRPAIKIKSNTNLIGSRGTILKCKTEPDSALSTKSFALAVCETGGHNIRISNIAFDGGYEAGHLEMGSRPSLGGINLTDVVVSDCSFRQSSGKHIHFDMPFVIAPERSDLAATSANTSSPVVTSGAYPFVAGDVGQYVALISGTNWYAGVYRIVSVAAGAATLAAGVGEALHTSGGVHYNTVAGIASVASPTSGTWKRRPFEYDDSYWSDNIIVEDCEFHELNGNNISINGCRNSKTLNCFFHDHYAGTFAEALLTHDGQIVVYKNVICNSEWGEVVVDQSEGYHGAHTYQLRNMLFGPAGRGTVLGAHTWQTGTSSSATSLLANLSIEGAIFRYDDATGDGNGFNIMRITSEENTTMLACVSIVANTAYDTLGVAMSGRRVVSFGNCFTAKNYTSIAGSNNFYSPGNSPSTDASFVGNIFPFKADSRGDRVVLFGNCTSRGEQSTVTSANSAWFGNAIVHDSSIAAGSSPSFNVATDCTNIAFVGNYVSSLISSGGFTVITKGGGTFRILGAYNRVATSSASGAAGNWATSKANTHKNNNSNPSGACNWTSTSIINYSST